MAKKIEDASISNNGNFDPILEERKVKALEKIANSVDALTLWFEEIDKEDMDAIRDAVNSKDAKKKKKLYRKLSRKYHPDIKETGNEDDFKKMSSLLGQDKGASSGYVEPDDKKYEGLYKEWNSENPVHLIGHSTVSYTHLTLPTILLV